MIVNQKVFYGHMYATSKELENVHIALNRLLAKNILNQEDADSILCCHNVIQNNIYLLKNLSELIKPEEI